MHLWLSLSVEANVQVKQMGVDGRGDLSRLRVPEKCSIVRGSPDWNPAPFGAQTIEIVPEAFTLPFSAVLALETAIFLYEHRTVCFEAFHLFTRGEYIRGKLGDITDRPGQQRLDDRFGNTRCEILANVTVASDAGWCAPGPWLESQADGREMITIDVEISRDFQKVPDYNRPAGTVCLEMANVAIQKRLADLAKIDSTKLVTHELEEASCAVEGLPDTAGRKYLAMTRHVDVQPGIEELAKRLADTVILDRPKMHGDVTAAGVLAKYGRSEVPARIAVAREGVAIKARLQRSGCENRATIKFLGGRECWRRSDHCRASGGR
ncbi:hypothetical protein [Sinorhizobium medicae]